MHKWEDLGIILHTRPFGEQSGIVKVLTRHHGVHSGMVKGVYSRKQRGIYQTGNVLQWHWQARLEEQLGSMNGEMVVSVTSQLLGEPMYLHMVQAASAMVATCLHERVNEEEIFHIFNEIICNIQQSVEVIELLHLYNLLEMELLTGLGFGLDFSQCASLGRVPREALCYVSPRSGIAVSKEAGEPYKDRMLPLPPFLRDGGATTDLRQMLDGLALTGYFLENRVLAPEGRVMPEARRHWLQKLHTQHEKTNVTC